MAQSRHLFFSTFSPPPLLRHQLKEPVAKKWSLRCANLELTVEHVRILTLYLPSLQSHQNESLIPRVERVSYATQSTQQAKYLVQSYLNNMEYLHVLAIEYYAKGHHAAVKPFQIVVENDYYSPTTSKQSREVVEDSSFRFASSTHYAVARSIGITQASERTVQRNITKFGVSTYRATQKKFLLKLIRKLRAI
jgi:hypothetical protein